VAILPGVTVNEINSLCLGDKRGAGCDCGCCVYVKCVTVRVLVGAVVGHCVSW
jgi:hypothetical protein